MKNGKITGKLRWQPDKFRAETTHQLYLLCLHTDAMTEDTEFEVHVTRPGDRDVAVERVIRLRATVRPNAK